TRLGIVGSAQHRATNQSIGPTCEKYVKKAVPRRHGQNQRSTRGLRNTVYVDFSTTATELRLERSELDCSRRDESFYWTASVSEPPILRISSSSTLPGTTTASLRSVFERRRASRLTSNELRLGWFASGKYTWTGLVCPIR